MKASSRLQVQMLVQNGVFAVLLVAAAILVAWLFRDSRTQWDLTQNQRNTLSKATVDVLTKMDGPIQVTAYATKQDPNLGDIRRVIHDYIEPYRRAKPDLKLSYVDPREQPKETQAANVRSNGELVLEYRNRTEHLTDLNEQGMANLLQRLARSQERLIVYLDGHGEPKLDGRANFDLGDFGRQLSNKGFRIQPLNLASAQDVPQNASVLVIATPRVDLLKGEVDKVRRYLERGGNLLWLIDPEPLHGLQSLAEYLGLQLTPGVVVDPTAAELRIAPTIALATTSYGVHPITDNFSLNTAFPFARQITTKPENGDWHATQLVEVAPRGWVETGDLKKDLRFDEGREVHGPVVVAVALERRLKDKDQRVVVVGTSQVLSNQYVGLLSNLDLGTNMLNWLAEDENLITVQARPRVDSQLNLGRAGLSLIGFGYLLILPAAFLLTGGVVWWRRRKA
ncbi:MAG TPA: GldG family protein [Burkholderiales bacterium]|nr:GldG family protein [Burkholderiales bacterium]